MLNYLGIASYKFPFVEKLTRVLLKYSLIGASQIAKQVSGAKLHNFLDLSFTCEIVLRSWWKAMLEVDSMKPQMREMMGCEMNGWGTYIQDRDLPSPWNGFLECRRRLRAEPLFTMNRQFMDDSLDRYRVTVAIGRHSAAAKTPCSFRSEGLGAASISSATWRL